MPTITFTEAALEAFRALSRDDNPLHGDGSYARRTEFGRTVFFGMGVVVRVLATWAAGRPFRLLAIRARFPRPMFPGVAYRLDLDERGDRVTFAVVEDGALCAKGVFQFTSATSAFPWPEEVVADARVVDPSRFGSAQQIESVTYAPDLSRLSDFESAFGLCSSQLPYAQLRALLWCSYFAGMEYPGTQALLSDFELEFDAGEAGGRVVADELRLSYRSDYRIATVQGRGPGVPKMVVRAFVRPPPVRHPIDEVERRLGRSDRSAGRTVLITGASRGFGAVLAKAYALEGAAVWLNYAASQDDAREVAREIGLRGLPARLLRADISTEEGCRAVARAVAESPPDLLILNAAPSSLALPFADPAGHAVLDFVARSLAMISTVARAILPQMKAGSLCVFISSRLVVHPEADFRHVVAAKSAGEALVRALAADHPAIGFAIVRPPRMLTDQTSSPVARGPVASAVEVAAVAIAAIATRTTARGGGQVEPIDVDP